MTLPQAGGKFRSRKSQARHAAMVRWHKKDYLKKRSSAKRKSSGKKRKGSKRKSSGKKRH